MSALPNQFPRDHKRIHQFLADPVRSATGAKRGVIAKELDMDPALVLSILIELRAYGHVRHEGRTSGRRYFVTQRNQAAGS